ncbi:efflux RND transporter permease subunit [uncultured Alistipes sp.]|uniref:efflux RND transporter permease subunit n=1 Tax=uncultured Alistipes sp. TaxID=538949 RepID=UPI000E7FCD06|nr:efflux RND transporter permease subunit [uncultured Alistipes sp.]HBL69942.1 hydrophobe/amphiphile efflux-1 family RND transporter [Alistipes sp.]HBW02013.1 hydrophobe/amphiphile efflux-1 family RND transporter [Alistipes sp.]
MTLKSFIERPVLASVISIVIVIAGIIGLASLPVEQYPDIAPPTVMVRASYPGASAETIQKSVIVPLEEAINGVEDMTYITSAAAAGSASISIYFKQGTDPDMAAVNVQNKVSTATGQLPSEVTQIGVTTMKRQTSMVKIFSLYSPDDSYDEGFLANYSKINIEPRIVRIPGVGEAFTLGSDYSMRIWLKPDVMAQYKLMPSDITAVLAEQNIEASTGSLGENSKNAFQYTMKYSGRLTLPEEFENIVILAQDDGTILRLKDVADIELGRESYAYVGKTNGHPGVSTMVFQTAGSNATEVVNQINALLDEVEADLPKGIAIAHLHSVNDFLFASINEVIKTLIEAIILVVLVVYVFLQDIRSTLVPTISILVSLIGTFAFLAVAGFSINLLTLFALVLAIGTVVDDAIIVVEAVQARFDAGYKSSYMATIDAMSGITSAIITSTLVFMAVFIPVAMMGGTSGVFYTQFGITMAVAVGISALNALTLSPALCALLLKPYLDENGEMKDNFAARFRKAFNTIFSTLVNKYKHGVMLFIKHKWLMWSTFAIAIAALVLLMNSTKTGLVPDEDQGTIMVNVTTPPGTSLEETNKVLETVASRIADIPQVENAMETAGFNMIASAAGSSYAMGIVKLKNWDERPNPEDEVQAVIGQIYARTADIKNAQIFAVAPPMISGYGSTSGFSMYLQDRAGGELTDFYQIFQQFIGALNQRPEIERAYSSFNINFPQYMVHIDPAKAKRAGVSPSTILSTIAGYYGGQYASYINRFSKMYYVTLQSRPEDRLDVESLNNIYVRTDKGEMAPVGEFVELEKVYSSDVLNRFNLYNAISVQGTAAPGYSSGDAIQAIREVADQVLPKGYGYEFDGITREEAQTTSNTLIIFGICLLFIYLILSALYESYLIPFAVILAVPCGLMGSFLFAKVMGLENNIYLQTGIIMLIGLLSKTAILITEYAADRRRAGMSLTQAAVSAAKARLRPVLMTVLTCVLGMLPLVFSTGAGANGNSTLGTGVVGGMIVGTLALLFLVPTLFIVFQTLQEKVKPLELDPDPQWSVRAEVEEVKNEKEE